MIQGENKLTPEIKNQLKQGSKVEFNWHGSKQLYTGRIEIYDNRLYFVNEHCFIGNELLPQYEGMRYYKELNSFFHFNHFKIMED